MQKALFGAYLNTAQHNAYMIINEINEKLGAESDVEDESLIGSDASLALTVLTQTKISFLARQLFAENQLLKGFPFLRALGFNQDANIDNNHNSKLAKLKQTVQKILTVLNKYRNLYSHFQDQDIDFQTYQFDDLDTIRKDFIKTFTSHANKKEVEMLYEKIKECQAELENCKKKLGFAKKDRDNKKVGELTAKEQALKDKLIQAQQAHFQLKEKKERRENLLQRYPQITGAELDRLTLDLQNDYHSFWDKDNPYKFSENGLVFFICLFLTKQQADLFLDSISRLQRTDSNYFKAVRAMYMHNCCFLPQPRLESSDVLLDMLGELSRCPKQLYELLPKEDREEFEKEINYREGAVLQTDEEDNLITVQKRLRHQDRFPLFALKYFDETNAFPDMRFQLYLGKLVTDIYSKPKMLEKNDLGELVEQVGERQLLKDIHVFGKPNDFGIEKVREEYKWKVYQHHDSFGEQTKAELQKNDIVQYSPQYNISGNRIALKILKSTKDEAAPRIIEKEGKINLANVKYPDAIISTHELSDLFLYQYLHKQELITTSAEQFIDNYVALFRKFFTDLPNLSPIPEISKKFRKKYIKKKDENISHPKGYPYPSSTTDSDVIETFEELEERQKLLQTYLDKHYKGLKIWHLPDGVKEYLMNISKPSYRQLALIKIDAIKAKTKKLLNECKQLEKKKPDERSLKAGYIAQILAKDIVYLRKHHNHIDKKGKTHESKLNDEEYNRLQNLFAYFQQEDIQKHLEQYRLLELHPFLKDINVLKAKNLYKYYKKYLERRKTYFGGNKELNIQGVYTEIDGIWEKKKWEKERRLIKAGISELEIAEKYGYLFNFELTAKEEPTKLNKNYLNVPEGKGYKIPIALPSSLFKDAIIEGVAKAMEKENRKLQFANNNRTIVYALKNWLHNDTQVFYETDRLYKLPEKSRDLFSKNAIEEIENKVINLKGRKDLFEAKKIRLEKWINKPKFKDEKEEKTQKEALMKFRSSVLSTEKILRLEEHKDRVLWLMAKDLSNKRIQGTVVDFKDFRLKNLEEFLNTHTTMKVTIQYACKKADVEVNNIIAGVDCVKEKQLIDVGFVSETLKIKDYGDLRKFAKDRRLPNFFRYFPNKPLIKIDLEKALSILEKRSVTQREGDTKMFKDRISVLEKAFELEKAIHELNKALYKRNGATNYNFDDTNLGKYWKQEQPKDTHISHNTYIKFLQDNVLGLNLDLKTILSLTDKDLKDDKELAKEVGKNQNQSLEATLIIMLRNKIMHNEVPYNTFLAQKIALQKLETPLQVIEAIIDIVIDIYEKLTSAVELS